MSKPSQPKIMLDLSPKMMGQCCPEYGLFRAQTRAKQSDKGLPRALPKVDLIEGDWRKACMAEKGHIPAGYTYLGQLIGHDVGDSRNADQIPHTQTETVPGQASEAEDTDEDVDIKGVQTGTSQEPNGRYNIIENPLTFETLYGSGPITLHHVFDPVTMLFRVETNQPFSINLSHGAHRHIYAIYDVRNRDNLMIHQLTSAWMRYHNYVALSFCPDLVKRADFERGFANKTFVKARKHLLATWHRVIRKDYINMLIHPDVAALSDDKFFDFPGVDETTLQHGVFRTFHCMPREDYRIIATDIPNPVNLNHLLARHLPKPSFGEQLNWKANLEELFDGSATDGDKTGVSASLTHSLKHLIRRDFLTAQDTDPLRLAEVEMQRFIAQLPNADWRDQLTAESLSAAFNAHIAPQMNGATLEPDSFKQMPLYVLLMIEAQLYGGAGRLGPLGSVLLRRALTQRIDGIEYGKDDTPPDAPEELSSMIEIIKTLKGNGYV